MTDLRSRLTSLERALGREDDPGVGLADAVREGRLKAAAENRPPRTDDEVRAAGSAMRQMLEAAGVLRPMRRVRQEAVLPDRRPGLLEAATAEVTTIVVVPSESDAQRVPNGRPPIHLDDRDAAWLRERDEAVKRNVEPAPTISRSAEAVLDPIVTNSHREWAEQDGSAGADDRLRIDELLRRAGRR